MGHKILAVDDNKDTIAILSLLLRKEGYQVVTAMDGLEAIHQAEQELPALILLDVMIPKKDGIEVCRMIKENSITKEIPILFLTAKVDLATYQRGLAVGGCEYIIKPINPRQILQIIKKHIPAEPPPSEWTTSTLRGVFAVISTACLENVTYFFLPHCTRFIGACLNFSNIRIPVLFGRLRYSFLALPSRSILQWPQRVFWAFRTG